MTVQNMMIISPFFLFAFMSLHAQMACMTVVPDQQQLWTLQVVPGSHQEGEDNSIPAEWSSAGAPVFHFPHCGIWSRSGTSVGAAVSCVSRTYTVEAVL